MKFFVCETSSSSIFSDPNFSPEKLKEGCREKLNLSDSPENDLSLNGHLDGPKLFSSACEVKLESTCHVYQQLINV